MSMRPANSRFTSDPGFIDGQPYSSRIAKSVARARIGSRSSPKSAKAVSSKLNLLDRLHLHGRLNGLVFVRLSSYVAFIQWHSQQKHHGRTREIFLPATNL